MENVREDDLSLSLSTRCHHSFLSPLLLFFRRTASWWPSNQTSTRASDLSSANRDSGVKQSSYAVERRWTSSTSNRNHPFLNQERESFSPVMVSHHGCLTPLFSMTLHMHRHSIRGLQFNAHVLTQTRGCKFTGITENVVDAVIPRLCDVLRIRKKMIIG